MHRPSARKTGAGAGRAGRDLRPGRAALAVGFAFGVAFGLALGAVAYFMNLKSAPSGVLAYAIHLSRHPDIAEDLIWLFSGAMIGAMFAAYGAWRAEKRRGEGFGKEHVLHRTFRVLDGASAAEPPGDGKSGNTAGS